MNKKLEISNISRRKLVMVKRVYQQAITDASISYSSHHRLFAIIGFDWCVESTLKTILIQLNSSEKLAFLPFNKLIDKINEVLKKSDLELPKEVPDRARIDKVRYFRNGAQHEAAIPNANDINDCRTYVRDFLRLVYDEFWSEDFERFSLAEAIEYEEARNNLLEAEIALDEGKFYKALFSATLAFHHGLMGYADQHYMPNVDLPIHLDNSIIESITEAIKDLQERVKTITLGIDMAEYHRFEQLTMGLVLTSYGVLYNANLDEDSVRKSDAHYVVSFCTNSLLHMQEQYGPPDLRNLTT